MRQIFIRDHEMVIDKDVYDDLISKQKVREAIMRVKLNTMVTMFNDPVEEFSFNLLKELGSED
jgi:hypothetical protein